MHKMLASAATIIAVGLAAPAMAQQNAKNSETEVLVDQGSAEVDVKQPAPEVTVIDPEPKVMVETPKPEVVVQQPEPDVKIDQAKPEVDISTSGQAEVTVKETETTATTTPSQGDASQQQAEGDRDGPIEDTAEAAASATGEAVREAGQEIDQAADEAGQEIQQGAAEVTDGDTTLGAAGGNQKWQELIGQTVMAQGGKEVGEISEVIVNDQGKTMLVIERGGFLGLGEKQYALDVEDIQVSDQGVTIPMNADQVAELPEYEGEMQGMETQGGQTQ